MLEGGDRLSLTSPGSAKSRVPPERQHNYAAPPLVRSQGEKSHDDVSLTSLSASFLQNTTARHRGAQGSPSSLTCAAKRHFSGMFWAQNRASHGRARAQHSP
jgi:hypothetical protein